MTTFKCPDGHDSTDSDFCSECGTALATTPVVQAPVVPSTSERTCSKCGHSNLPDADFCEACGADLTTGEAAPVEASIEPVPVIPVIAPVVVNSVNRWVIKVSVDPSLDKDPDASNPCPVSEPVRTFPLDLPESILGRKNASPSFHPDIPIGDAGISKKHLSFKLTSQTLEVMDLGSTNGTAVNGKFIADHVPVELNDGDDVTVGSWTRIKIQRG